MPPKQTFTKEIVEQAAFDVVRSGGYALLSARTVSEKLGSSTMPIYSHMKSMDAINRSIREKALVTLSEYQLREYTPNALLNMAVGYVLFAQEENHLFKFLYFDKPDTLTEAEQHNIGNRIKRETGREVDLNMYFNFVNADEMDDITLKSWFFTHGLAVALMSGAVERMDESRIISLLTEAGSAFYEWVQKRKK
jgi:hypothetical protein